MTDVTVFKDKQLTDRTHNDPDRHWIGESLPAPSDEETTYAGTTKTAGFSIFPARADHSHDFRTVWGGFRSSVTATGKSVAAGATAFLDDLIFAWGPNNLLVPASSQLINFPQEGVWNIHHRLVMSRSAGVFPANKPFEIIYKFNNATASHFMELNLYPEGQDQMWIAIIDEALYASVSAISNVQIEVTNGDSVAVNFRTYQLTVRRAVSFQGTGEL